LKAIILAAGMGRRISEISGGLPKSMINIGGKSLIHHQIDSCLSYGIDRFVIVLGYNYNQMKNHILQLVPEEKVTFIRNEIYDKTNTLYSLWLTRSLFDESFIYFNADVLFHPRLLGYICKENERSELLLETKSCGEEEVKMIINEKGMIKEIGKKLPIEKCAGEFIGIGKFDMCVLNEFRNCLDEGIALGQENNYFEYAVNSLCSIKEIFAVSTNNLPCIEIDFPEDLERAKKEVLPQIIHQC